MLKPYYHYIFPVLIVFTLAYLFLSYQIADYTLLDLDEPRYPKAAREMIEAAQYILPMTNGKFLFAKPILIYWAQILSFKTFGITEFAARLPSVLAASLTIVMSYIFSRILKISWFLPVILACSVEFFVIARLSIADMLLNFFIISVLALYYLIAENFIDKKFFLLLVFFVSMGFLAKGPLAIFVPTLVIATYSLAKHFFRISNLKNTLTILNNNLQLLFLMFLIFLFCGLGWYLVAHNASSGEFTKQFFLTENLQRFTSTLSGHKHDWYFYILVMLVGFLPWSIFIPSYLINLKANLELNFKIKLFAFSWILSCLLFFSSSGTKLYNYIFSVFFPLALLLALWLHEKSRKKEIFFTSLILLALSISLYFTDPVQTLLKPGSILLSFVTSANLLTAFVAFLVLMLVGLLPFSQKKYFIVFSSVLIYLFCFSVTNFLRPFAKFKTGGIQRFVTKIPNAYNLYSLDMDRPSLGYYANKYVTIIKKKKLKKITLQNEKFCILAKKNAKHFLEQQKSLILRDQDFSYVFFCSLPAITPTPT